MSLTIVPVETPTLGDRSYLVHDGEVAFVVDPQRDIDRVTDLLAEHEVRLTHVFETHLHNDYVTGGFALAAGDRSGVPRQRRRRGLLRPHPDQRRGDPRGRPDAHHRPGDPRPHLHPPLLRARRGRRRRAARRRRSASSPAAPCSSAPPAVRTCSALSTPTNWSATSTPPHTGSPRLLPDDAAVFPTHGFGSFCSATQSDATESTIGHEKEANPVLTQDEETYVRELLDGLGAWPAYYAHMAPANAAGPAAPDLTPPHVADAAELRRRIEAGEWVVDLRNRTAFAAGHAPGTLNFGLDGGFATYLGWLIGWGTPLTLLGETADDVATAQRELVRIGIDRLEAQATGGPEDWAVRREAWPPSRPAPSPTSPRSATTARSSSSTSAAPRSTTRPGSPVPSTSRSTSCLDRLADVPVREVWVHCAGGYRASVAASFLDAAGRTLVAVDDSFENAEKVGLHLVGPTPPTTAARAAHEPSRSPSSPAPSSG